MKWVYLSFFCFLPAQIFYKNETIAITWLTLKKEDRANKTQENKNIFKLNIPIINNLKELNTAIITQGPLEQIK